MDHRSRSTRRICPRLVHAVPALLAFALSACGGGNDGGGTSPPPPVNRAPVAAISGPTTVETGNSIQFDGTGSSDADGDALTWRWTLSAPAGSAAQLSSTTASRVNLQPDLAGSYRLTLVVNDGDVDSAPVLHDLQATAPSPIQATLRSPAAGQKVDTTVPIVVTVASDFEVQEIRASLVGVETSLAFDPEGWCPRQGCGPGFTGMLSLAGQVPGVYLLTVRAIDVRGNEDVVEANVTYDQPPELTATAPLDQSVALQAIAVQASCADDLPGCSVEALINDQLVLERDSFVDEELSLVDWVGAAVTLTLRARDSANQLVEVDRTIYVEEGSRLTRRLDLPGPIVDVAGERLLYVEPGESGDSLSIHDGATGQSERIALPDGRTVRTEAAFLTPSGAIFVTQATGGNVLTSRVYLWSLGTFTDLAYPDSAVSLRVAGDFAIWNERTDLYRLDTRGSAPELLATDAGNWQNSVAPDGMVAYWNRDYDVVLIQGGFPSVITDDPVQWHTYPSTDGQLTVYRRHDPCCIDQQYELRMYDGASTTPLASRRLAEPIPGRDYQVRDGWIAFTDVGNLGQLHVWTRSPAGALLQHTDLGSGSTIDTLADDGQLMILNNQKRYFSRGTGLIEVSSANGRSYRLDGRWFVAIGRSLLEVNTD